MSSKRSNRLTVIVGVVVLVIAGVATFNEFVKPNLFPKRFHEVTPNEVYRSGQLTSSALATVVEENGIKTIVDLGGTHAGTPGDRREQRAAETLGVTRYRFELNGWGGGNANNYLNTLRIMSDPANQPVLVHCAAGTERTGAAIVFYRHIVEGVSLDAAMAEANEIGHDDKDNPHWRGIVERWAGPLADAYASGGELEGEEPLPAPTPVGSDD